MLTGLSPRTIRRDVSTFDRIIHHLDRERIIKAARLQEEALGVWSQQYRLLVPDRGTHWIQSVAHVERTPEGNIFWTGFITDIAAIKRAEEALQISEERIALAARAGKVGLWDYDFITHEIIWNSTQYEIHGVHPDNHVPNLTNNFRFLHPDSRAHMEEVFERCISSGAHKYQVECQIIRAAGDIRTTRSSAFIIRNEKGEPIRAVGTEVDITEEKRLLDTLARAREAAEAATQAKSDFLARMSHEIRTPMNAIVAPAELLVASDFSPAHRELASMILNAGEHLLQIVNDILDFSKLEAGKMTLQLERFSIETLVQETVGLMGVLANKKQIKLRSDLSKGCRGVWIGDRGKIKQILFNLLSNAIKFTAKGEIIIAVSIFRRRKENAEILFKISDTGVGISEADQVFLFQPFEQARLQSSTYQSGTGLGLAISRNLVELMSGTIGLSSQLKKGSTFWFSIPLIPSAEKASKPVPRLRRPTLGRQKKKRARILIVEDNASNRHVLTLLLKRLGFESELAVNGADAVEKHSLGQFDLLLMDFEMPIMNGVAATQEIRHRESGEHRVPIVAVTAHVSPEHRAACYEAGMNEVLSKPIIMADLKKILAKFLVH